MQASWIIQTLAQPQARSTLAEFFEIQASGAARIPETTEGGEGAEGARTEMRAVIDELFDVISDLVHEHAVVARATQALDGAGGGAGGAAGDPDDALAAAATARLGNIETARAACTGEFLSHAIVGVYLMRRKLRALGPKAQNEEDVVDAVDGIVAMLAPGISVRELWLDNRPGCTRLWTTLNAILRAMDRHCPETKPPTGG